MCSETNVLTFRPKLSINAVMALAVMACFIPVAFGADPPAAAQVPPATSNAQPVTSTTQSSVSGGQPNTSSTQPTAAGSQPGASSSQPTASGVPSDTSSSQSASSANQPHLTLEPPDEFQEQGRTNMDQLQLNEPNAEPLGLSQLGLPPEKQPWRNEPFFRDTTFGGQIRTFYIYRDNNHALTQAWAIGGSLSYKSGYLADIFAVGAVGYTSQPLYAPADRDGSLLLKPGQEGYTVLGQAYAEFKLADKIFIDAGRKSYETPFMNSNDTRMTPNTFEGATLYGKMGGENGTPAWRFGTGYIWKIKPRNSDSFEWMSQAAGANGDRGVVLGGANVDWNGLSAGAIDYYSADVINIFYTEVKYALLKGERYKLSIAAQYSDQRSVGEDLIPGGVFAAGQWGVKTDLALGDAVLTAGFTDVTSSNTSMQAPWSGYPGYTSVQVQDFDRAHESALILKAAYDFSNLGLKGVSAYALWVHGNGRELPNFNQDEYDLNLQWAIKDGWLKGTTFRTRYAYVAQHGGGDPANNDFRFIMNYDF